MSTVNCPLISVIVPLYNKEQWIEKCIFSILGQSYQNMEILIINDGSTDKSLNIVSSIDDARMTIIDRFNGGVSSARNLGIKSAQGEFIAFLDADDEWKVKHLEVLLEGFERFKDAVVACDDLLELRGDESKEAMQRRKLPFDANKSDVGSVHYFGIKDYLQTLRDDYFILSGSSVLIRLSVIREHQLYFYEHLTHGEDVNYWIQLSSCGKFVFCDYLGVVYHHVDEKSAMNQKIKQAQLTPDYFYGLVWEGYSNDDQEKVLKFLRREYYKKAYQNRGLSSKKEEFLGKIGDIQMGYFSVMIYTIIRFCPIFIFAMYKRIKNLKGKE